MAKPLATHLSAENKDGIMKAAPEPPNLDNRVESFFVDENANFFRPLVGRYREVVVSCLRELYSRLYSWDADYNVHLNREDVLTIFQGAISRTAILESDPDMDASDETDDNLSVQDRAAKVLRRLMECGWITDYMDSVTMRKSYQLSPTGRRFCAPFVRDFEELLPQTKNTRTTLSLLNNFYNSVLTDKPNPQDLLFAVHSSSKVVIDLNSLIEELDEKKRYLIKVVNKDLEEAKQAGDDIMGYVRNRLVPELRTRIKTDSIERYKSEILGIIDRLHALPNDKKAHIERALRSETYRERLPGNPASILLWALDTIDTCLNKACELKVPELRHQADSFMRRMQLLIDHLTTISYGEHEHESIFKVVSELKTMAEEDFNSVLDGSLNDLGHVRMGLINPSKVRLPIQREKQVIDDTVTEPVEETAEQKRQRYILNALEKLFAVNTTRIRESAIKELANGRKLQASDVLIGDVDSLLFVLNGPVVGSIANEKNDFIVHPVGQTYENPYLIADDYEIEYVGPELKEFEARHD